MKLWFIAGLLILALGSKLLAQDAAPKDAPKDAPKVAAEGKLTDTTVDTSKTAAGTEKKHKSGGFMEIISRAGWFGEVIWFLLFACLLAGIWLAADSFITISDKRIAPQTLVVAVRSAMDNGDLVKAMSHCDAEPSPLARILKAGFNNVSEGYEVVQDAVSVAADIEGERMLQRVTYLSVISNTSPMLGLIGTVQGMIMAFYTMGTMQAGAAQQSMLAVNISHGLWATAIGLGTAVPATIFYYYFKNKATRSILFMEAMTLDLIKVLRNVEVVE